MEREIHRCGWSASGGQIPAAPTKRQSLKPARARILHRRRCHYRARRGKPSRERSWELRFVPLRFSSSCCSSPCICSCFCFFPCRFALRLRERRCARSRLSFALESGWWSKWISLVLRPIGPNGELSILSDKLNLHHELGRFVRISANMTAFWILMEVLPSDSRCKLTVHYAGCIFLPSFFPPELLTRL